MPIIDDGTTHVQKTISIYSNDGTSLLYSNGDWYTGYNIEVTETGLAHTEGFSTSYDYGKSILGFATSANATEPTYAVGDTFQISADTTLYVIEAKSSGVTVEYNGSVVATIENGNKATLPIKDLKMKSDIVVTVPEATDSPLPTEVSTESEMTALLTSGEVGGVYKYTGTTGTYENGALYVLEEASAGVTVKILGWYQTGFGYYSVNGGEDVQIADENYVVNATITKELADSACITLTNVTSLICKMTSMDVTFVNIKDSNFNDVEAELYGDWNDNYQQVLDVTSYLTEGCYVILYTDD